MGTKWPGWTSRPTPKPQSRTHRPRKSRTAAFTEPLSSGQLRLFHERPVNFEPVAVLERLLAARHLAENTHRRPGQVHAEKILVRGGHCECVGDGRTRCQQQCFYDAVLRPRVDDLDADHGWPGQISRKPSGRAPR